MLVIFFNRSSANTREYKFKPYKNITKSNGKFCAASPPSETRTDKSYSPLPLPLQNWNHEFKLAKVYNKPFGKSKKETDVIQRSFVLQ